MRLKTRLDLHELSPVFACVACALIALLLMTHLKVGDYVIPRFPYGSRNGIRNGYNRGIIKGVIGNGQLKVEWMGREEETQESCEHLALDPSVNLSSGKDNNYFKACLVLSKTVRDQVRAARH